MKSTLLLINVFFTSWKDVLELWQSNIVLNMNKSCELDVILPAEIYCAYKEKRWIPFPMQLNYSTMYNAHAAYTECNKYMSHGIQIKLF